MISINKLLSIDTVFSAFKKTFERDYSYDGERHDFYEIVFVADGCIGVAEDERVYELKGRELIIHKPMEFHRIWSARQTTPTVIIFSFQASVFDKKLNVLGDGVFKIDRELEKLLTLSLESALLCAEYSDELEKQMLANRLEAFILRLFKSKFPVTTQKKTIGTQNYKQIIQIMNENIGNKLSSAEIAVLCNMSLANLKKTFKKFSGMGVMDYFNRLKITKAVQMLEQSVPISQISESLGFLSVQYFITAFKRYTAMTPTEYKKQYTDSVYIFKDLHER